MIKKIFMHYYRMLVYFLVNVVFEGANPHYFEIKRKLLNSIGYKLGRGTKIVAPIECAGELIVGEDCWIGANFTVRGNGKVILGNRIDVAPDVTFFTGTHYIGDSNRRAGQGYNCVQEIESGCWIGGRSSFVNQISIGASSVIAAGSLVCKSVGKNSLMGGCRQN